MKVLLVLGAYGHKYRNSKEVCDDWWRGEDFLVVDGPYINIEEVPLFRAKGYTHIHILDYEMHETLAVLHLGTITDD